MGKASRRKKRTYADQPIQVINEDTGEVIEQFVNPTVAKYINQMIMSGATKEEITEFVSTAVMRALDEREATLPLDGQRKMP